MSAKYCFFPATVFWLFDGVKNELGRTCRRTKPLLPVLQLAIFLRLLATGAFYSVLRDIYSVTPQAVVRRVAAAARAVYSATGCGGRRPKNYLPPSRLSSKLQVVNLFWTLNKSIPFRKKEDKYSEAVDEYINSELLSLPTTTKKKMMNINSKYSSHTSHQKIKKFNKPIARFECPTIVMSNTSQRPYSTMRANTTIFTCAF